MGKIGQNLSQNAENRGRLRIWATFGFAEQRQKYTFFY